MKEKNSTDYFDTNNRQGNNNNYAIVCCRGARCHHCRGVQEQPKKRIKKRKKGRKKKAEEKKMKSELTSSPLKQQQHRRQGGKNNRIVLLFDLDCFYAQCERVRLGLRTDISLALLQWNSVLAVTYPARKFGIKRGDSWDDVNKKSNGNCWSIHLKILERHQQEKQHQDQDQGQEQNQESHELTSSTKLIKEEKNQSTGNDQIGEDDEEEIPNLEQVYDEIYKLSREEQLACQEKEKGVRRFYYEGKACLERYRIASKRIFSVVLESLTRRLGGKDQFILERASIDEFYLDITKYCYDTVQQGQEQLQPLQVNGNDKQQTVVVGILPSKGTDDPVQLALQRACQVSHWVRNDLWNVLGFTMSAGISTNKMMAKLSASHGKPNGQAVAHPVAFSCIMHDMKIGKVRHFGGKLGKQIREKVLGGCEADRATMGKLARVSLPTLQQHFEPSRAQFIFDAARGIDNEAVKETVGALVRSITAFKSFPLTRDSKEIETWVRLLASEVIERVTKDTAQNKRYPKTCTLNYTMYVGNNDGGSSAATTNAAAKTQATQSPPPPSMPKRRLLKVRSLRLTFPSEKQAVAQKEQSLVGQAMKLLGPVLVEIPLRGVGFSAGNFDLRGQAPSGVPSISSFFTTKKNNANTNGPEGKISSTSSTVANSRGGLVSENTRKTDGVMDRFLAPPVVTTNDDSFQETSSSGVQYKTSEKIISRKRQRPSSSEALISELKNTNDENNNDVMSSSSSSSLLSPSMSSSLSKQHVLSSPDAVVDADLDFAKRLQASFDRENYIYSVTEKKSRTSNGANNNRKSNGSQSSSSVPPKKKKTRKIDSFFQKMV